jgi:capsular exopolysaccharide synthesis family protein
LATPLRLQLAPAGKRMGGLAPAMSGKLVGLDGAPLALTEQYGRLATTLLKMQNERGVKTLMVSSALPGEGKTLTSANLALTLTTKHHQRVLLIDANLACPSIHALFQLQNDMGLSEGLASEQGPIRAVAALPGLTVVTGGRMEVDPNEVLVSTSMKDLIQEAASSYDWVLLDTPPVSVLEDAHLLAWLTDGVLLVVQAGSTPQNVVKDTVVELGRDRVIGLVLNHAG